MPNLKFLFPLPSSLNPLVAGAMSLAVMILNVGAADWTYYAKNDPANPTIAGLNPGYNITNTTCIADGNWVLMASLVNAGEKTIGVGTGDQYGRRAWIAGCGVLDLSKPVHGTDDSEYHITVIQQFAFAGGAKAITNLVLSTELREIKTYAFEKVSTIVDARCASTNLDSIGTAAFFNVPATNEFHTLVHPMVRSISGSNFDKFSGLNNVITLTNRNLSAAGVGSIKAYKVVLHSDVMTGLGGVVSSVGQYLELDMPNLRKISFKGFDGRSSLTNDIATIVSPAITNIDSEAFAGCSKLTGALVVTNLQFLGYWAFKNASSLEKAVITGDVSLVLSTANGPNTFIGCTKLKELIFAAPGLKSLPSSMFSGCLALDKVDLTMPELTSIGASTFYNCGTIESFRLDSRQPVKFTAPGLTKTVPAASIFTGPAPADGTLSNFLAGVSAKTEGDFAATIYASRHQPGWQALATAPVGAEIALKPSRCFGVYADNSGRKAWLIHKTSPYDPSGCVILVR